MRNFTIKSGIWLLVVALAFAAPAVARETYAEFARKLTAERSNARFRADLERYLLGAANQYRAGRGAEALRPSSANQAAARAHAMDMALHDFVGHKSSTGADFELRMRAFRPGQLFLPALGENAARVSSGEAVTLAKAQKLMQQWIGSPPHQKVLVNRTYSLVATGVVQKGNKLYAVQIFSGREVKTNVKARDLY